jgi:hypothetical protein
MAEIGDLEDESLTECINFIKEYSLAGIDKDEDKAEKKMSIKDIPIGI